MGFIGKMFGGGGDKPAAPPPKEPPKVTNEDSATNQDKEKMRRIGRASLIASDQRTILNNPATGRKKLTGGLA